MRQPAVEGEHGANVGGAALGLRLRRAAASKGDRRILMPQSQDGSIKVLERLNARNLLYCFPEVLVKRIV